MTWKNLKEFSRGKNESPKVSKVTLLVTYFYIFHILLLKVIDREIDTITNDKFLIDKIEWRY